MNARGWFSALASGLVAVLLCAPTQAPARALPDSHGGPLSTPASAALAAFIDGLNTTRDSLYFPRHELYFAEYEASDPFTHGTTSVRQTHVPCGLNELSCKARRP